MTTSATDARAEIERSSAYLRRPEKYCDLVMKGGVTSGVVYPRAVCELARSFRFKNIGGTSAGAIAAAGTAAAELGRLLNAPGGGYPEVARLPAWLGEDDHLFALFQPQPQTRPLFQILVAFSDQRSGGPLPAFWAALGGFKRWALGGALWGAAALVLAVAAGVRTVADASGSLQLATAIVLGVAGLMLLVIGGLAGLALGLVLRVTGAIPKNYYGIATGFSTATVGGVPALNIWLHGLLNKLAGIDGTRPLTFGDLWTGDPTLRDREPERWAELIATCVTDPQRREINLEMMTTCLTQGRPYRLPLDRRFYFHTGEFRRFFPDEVVRWMETHPPRPKDPCADAPVGEAGRRMEGAGRLLRAADDLALAAGYLPLPDAADFPVVLATRMSLSVPPLISAVPLYAVDLSLPEEQRRLEPCWFSDGGITSNFPVHFFDAPLPRWPTVGINLRGLRPGDALQDAQHECENVHLAQSNEDGVLESWRRFDTLGEPAAPGGLPMHRGGLTPFFGAILHTFQNWTDNLQILQPGYRDRVAHVTLAPEEGGMNLRMDAQTISRLSERGRCAGEKLRTRFATAEGDGSIMTWDNHRWLRYRRAMAALETFLKRFRSTYEQPASGDRRYDELIQRDIGAPPQDYGWEGTSQRAFAAQETTALADTVGRWETQAERFSEGAPRPENPLRLVPPR